MGLDRAGRDAESERDVDFWQVTQIAQDDGFPLSPGETDESGDKGDPKHDVVRFVSVQVAWW
jgi:hypothetical protein